MRRILHPGQNARVELGAADLKSLLFDVLLKRRKGSTSGRDNTVRAMPEYGLPIELPNMFSVESADAPG